jgi:hypothetical protein
MRIALVVVAMLLAVSCAETPARPRPPDPMTSPPHACEPFNEPKPLTPVVSEASRSYFATRHGCDCATAPGAPDSVCGTFPCTPGGCYVGTCQVDSDCAHGLCSHYASRPRGYCVSADPK